MSETMQHRRISPVIMKYMTVGYAVPFLCSLLGFAALFLLIDIFDDMSDFLSKKVPLGISFLYFLARQPQNMTNVVPISALLGASFTTLMMGRHNELTAMRAAGLSLFVCNIPVWLITAIACAAVFAVNESWGPACSEKANHIMATYVKKDRLIKRITFHHWRDKRDWTIENLTEDGSATGVIVRQYRQDGTNESLTAAQSAEFNKDQGWTFHGGFIQRYAEDGSQMFGKQEFFKELTLPYMESPQDICSHSIDWNLMRISELLHVLRSDIVNSRRELRLAKGLLWHRLTFPLAALVAALFGVAPTISTDRMGLLKGFAFAVGTLVLFYIVSELFMVLAKNGSLPPFLGGGVPPLAFLGAGVFTMLKRQ